MRKLIILIAILMLWQTGLTVAFIKSNTIIADYTSKKFTELKPIEWVMMEYDGDGFPVFMSADGIHLRNKEGEFEWDFTSNEFIPVIYPSASLEISPNHKELAITEVKPILNTRGISGVVKEKEKGSVVITDIEGKDWRIHDDGRVDEL